MHLFPSTHVAAASPQGGIIASINQARLVLRFATDGSLFRSIVLDSEFAARCKHVRWFPGPEKGGVYAGWEGSGSSALRLLIADDDTVHAYDVSNPQWHVAISGASSHTGKIANVEFGSTPDEILVFSDFGVKATIWSLATSRGVEIRDPKVVTRGFCFRPGTGHLAILTRPETRDVVMVLGPGTRELVSSFTLATVDSQGMRWSPDGRWLATWDGASSGSALFIYTPDGSLFKTYNGGEDVDNPGLGINRVEWDASGRYLVLGGNNDDITLLNTKSFQPTAKFQHRATITSPGASIYQEILSADHTRTYRPSPQPACPPGPPASTTTTAAPPPPPPPTSPTITHLAPSLHTSHLATVSASTPSTVWLWSLDTLSPTAILIHHSPLRSLAWHPTTPGLLLVHTATPTPTLHLWSPTTPPAIISLTLSLPAPLPRMTAAWVPTAQPGTARILLASARGYVVLRGDGTEDEEPAPGVGGGATPPVRGIVGSGPEDLFDEGNSMDLSPVKFSVGRFTAEVAAETAQGGRWAGSEGDVDDTFHYLRAGI